MWDEEAGYDRDDPKHPDYAEAMFDQADMQRKREKEDRVEAIDRALAEQRSLTFRRVLGLDLWAWLFGRRRW